jgi:hypothetical protein
VLTRLLGVRTTWSHPTLLLLLLCLSAAAPAAADAAAAAGGHGRLLPRQRRLSSVTVLGPRPVWWQVLPHLLCQQQQQLALQMLCCCRCFCRVCWMLLALRMLEAPQLLKVLLQQRAVWRATRLLLLLVSAAQPLAFHQAAFGGCRSHITRQQLLAVGAA